MTPETVLESFSQIYTHYRETDDDELFGAIANIYTFLWASGSEIPPEVRNNWESISIFRNEAKKMFLILLKFHTSTK